MSCEKREGSQTQEAVAIADIMVAFLGDGEKAARLTIKGTHKAKMLGIIQRRDLYITEPKGGKYLN